MTSVYTYSLNFHCDIGWKPHPMLSDQAQCSLSTRRHPAKYQSCIFAFRLNFCSAPLLTQNEHAKPEISVCFPQN